MRISSKLLIITMLVMLICCVTAVSATDVNCTDDTVVTDDIVADEISDVVEDVEIDDTTNGAVEENDNSGKDVNQGNLRGTTVTLTPSNYTTKFTNGVFNDPSADTVIFTGNFATSTYTNLTFNQPLTITATGSTFTNIGFDLLNNKYTFNGGTFNITAPNGADCFAFNVVDASNTAISNTKITYTCNYDNPANYNYVIKVAGGDNVDVSGNNISAYLPLKNVDFDKPYPSIYTDLVAGVAVQSSSNFRFTNNRLNVNVSKNSTGYPTLDAFIIVDSRNSYIAENTIVEIDNKTVAGNNNYLYAIDIYQCESITVNHNTIRLESQGGSIIPGTNNGTGAAYGIQLTGGHEGVTISNNNIHTSNNGPNSGIYSQNFLNRTQLFITGNTIYVEGNADSSHSWSLVTGMELQDNEAYIAGNIITVYNKANYTLGDNAYGISYSQSGTEDPSFTIYANTINLINGMYAVYLQSSTDSYAVNNCLNTTYCCGDAAVYYDGSITIYGNYCPNCNCENCTCTHP